MNKQRIKDVVIATAVTAMVVGTVPTAFAKVSKMDIPVSFNNIKVVVDGKELKTDKEPFIYEGTTYLPVRAVGEAVGKAVVWDSATQTVILGSTSSVATQAKQEEKKEEPTKDYSRSNPAPVGTQQSASVESVLGNYTAEIKVVSVERGSTAWTKIITANQFNEAPEDGKEYILAYVRATVKSSEDDKAVDFNSYSLTPFSGKDAEYKKVMVVSPDPSFSGKAYKDGTIEGYVAFLVDTTDSNPKFSFGTKYDGTGGVWFSLK